MATARINPSLHQLQRATAIAEQIESLQTQLNAILGGQPGSAAAETPRQGRRPGRRKMSAAARARIGAAARARWAKIKKNATQPAKPAAGKAKKKRTLSKETRAKIAQASKQRWAERKKQQGQEAAA